MKDVDTAFYAYLTILNTYRDVDSKGTSYNETIDGSTKEFELLDFISKDSGYQGYVYKNLSTGEIIVVHEGSIDPTKDISENWKELVNDWVKADAETVFDKLTSQFDDANAFLDKVKIDYENYEIKQIGQSLGGTLSELLGALEKNKDIETYTFNSVGAGNLKNNLLQTGEILSNDNSNIKNYTYSNELASTITPHIGEVYKSDYVEMEGGIQKYHSVEAHYKNGALNYSETENNDYLMNIVIDGINIFIDHTNDTIILKLYTDGFITDEQLNNYMNIISENGFLNQGVYVAQISMDNQLYTIQPGDTVWALAQRYGLTPEEMVELNPWLGERFSPDGSYALIRPGEQLLIPGGKSPIAQKLGDTFTEAEEVTVPRDPLLIDLDGDGIETTTLENGVYFDQENDGFDALSRQLVA